MLCDGLAPYLGRILPPSAQCYRDGLQIHHVLDQDKTFLLKMNDVHGLIESSFMGKNAIWVTPVLYYAAAFFFFPHLFLGVHLG